MSAGYDPTDLRGQELAKTEDAASKRESLRQEQDDLTWLMSQKRGRSFVWKLLSESGVFQASFNTNSMQMAFNEGNRSYGNKLLKEIMNVCPEFYLKAQQEAIKNVRHSNDGNADHSN